MWIDLLLWFHVTVAAAGLLIGPVAMAARKRRGLHTRMGGIYFWVVTVVSVSGAALALLDWAKLRMFLLIALGTLSFALLGYLAGKLRWRRWLLAHVCGMVCSYIQMVGAFVVNNWVHLTGKHGMHSPVAFLLPGGVGTVVVVWLMVQVYRGKRPKL